MLAIKLGEKEYKFYPLSLAPDHNVALNNDLPHAHTANIEILAIHLIWRFGDEQLNCQI